MKKKTAALLIALATLIFTFTACGNRATDTTPIYEGKALKIEREGAITRIYDLAGNTEYTFKTTRTRIKDTEAEPVKRATTTASTETIDIKTVHGLLIVTTADGETLYIK